MRNDAHNDSEGRPGTEPFLANDAAGAAAIAGEAGFVPGPLPPPARRYLRPSAYWADRWLQLRRP